MFVEEHLIVDDIEKNKMIDNISTSKNCGTYFINMYIYNYHLT